MANDETAPMVPGIADLPRLAAALGVRLARFETHLAALADWVEAGEIPNARYAEIKPRIADAILEGWTQGVGPALWDLPRDDVHRNALIDALDLPGITSLAALGRRLAKARNGEMPADKVALLDAAHALHAELVSVAAPLGWLAGRARKRNAPGTAPPAPELPKATQEAVDLVKGIMGTTFAGLREDFVLQIEELCEEEARDALPVLSELAELRVSLEAIQRTGKSGPAGERNRYATLRRDIVERMAMASQVLDLDYGNWTAVRRPDAERRRSKFAGEQADRVFALCIARNVEKLAPVIEAMGGAEIELVSAKVARYGIEADLRLDLAKGGGFRLSNRVEFARSPLGKWFVRFPARYHAAILPVGTPLKGPSEETVKKAFENWDHEAAPARGV